MAISPATPSKTGLAQGIFFLFFLLNYIEKKYKSVQSQPYCWLGFVTLENKPKNENEILLLKKLV